MVSELELAYAVTVHKSQGSEFDAVVMPVTSGGPMIMTRNLLYTAITRAKKMEVLIGERYNIKKMVDNNYVAKRYSSVPDSLVSVSSGEIKSFYNAHKEMFKQSPSRTLSYVVFEVNATDDDMLNLEKEVRAVGEKFDAAEDVKLFVRQDRHGEIADRYVTAAQLGEQAVTWQD